MLTEPPERYLVDARYIANALEYLPRQIRPEDLRDAGELACKECEISGLIFDFLHLVDNPIVGAEYLVDMVLSTAAGWAAPRRGRQYIPTAVRERVLARGFCRKCKATKNLVVDHIVPVAAGGSSNEWNLQALCATCNARKGDRL